MIVIFFSKFSPFACDIPYQIVIKIYLKASETEMYLTRTEAALGHPAKVG